MPRFSILIAIPLLAGLWFAPVMAANDGGPVTEIVLDCSVAMKGDDPAHSARIEVAWQALANHYRRLGRGQVPILRLAGGSPSPENPWPANGLVHDGGIGSSPFGADGPLPEAPLADGLLPLTRSLEAAAKDLQRTRNRHQGFILLIAAGWEGGRGNPHQFARSNGGRNGTPVIHVIGLAPRPDESRQLHQLAARSGGIYRKVAGVAGLERAIDILSGSGGIYFAAKSQGGTLPPAGSRLRIADRRGWYTRDFDYQDWQARHNQIWVPAGPYDLELTCSGLADPFPVEGLAVERGRLTRRNLTLPELGRLEIRLVSPEGSTRQGNATFSVVDDTDHPVFRQDNRDEGSIDLFPGSYRVLVRPYGWAGFGEVSRGFEIRPRGTETVLIDLPAEGLLELADPMTKIRLETRKKVPIWRGRPEGPISLPKGRYRVVALDDQGNDIGRKRIRIRAGRTCRVEPF
jgi:hypothetical protein